MPTMMMRVRDCTLTGIEGTTCGPRACPAFSACDYTDLCDQAALARRACNQPTCMGNACVDVPQPEETMPCMRTTEDLLCGSPEACSGPCAPDPTTSDCVTGIRTVRCLEDRCRAGACSSVVTRTYTESCTSIYPDGVRCFSPTIVGECCASACCPGTCVSGTCAPF